MKYSWLLLMLALVACDGKKDSSPDGGLPDGGSPQGKKSSSVKANIVKVATSGKSGSYTFSVTLKSDDTGCKQYANWWEVLNSKGKLLYRRVLGHSHVDEQPFTRSGGSVGIEANETVFIRAHMNKAGYSGDVFRGSVDKGFLKVESPPNFSKLIEEESPLPTGCAF